MHFETVIKSVRTELQAQFVFAPKMTGSLRFCADFRKLITVAKQELYLVLAMDQITICLARRQSFQRWMGTVHNRKKDEKETSTENTLHLKPRTLSLHANALFKREWFTYNPMNDARCGFSG